MSWSITEEKRKEKRNLKTPFIRLVIPRRKNVFSGHISFVAEKSESRDLVLSPSRSNLGLSMYFSDQSKALGEIYNLGMVWAWFRGKT